jgi:hypothetical protein
MLAPLILAQRNIKPLWTQVLLKISKLLPKPLSYL